MNSSAKAQIQTETPYAVEVDSCSADGWYEHLDRFADANLYQMWHWGSIFSPGRVSTLVLKAGGEVVAMAQLRLFPAGPLKGGIAFARWAPLWQLKDRPADPEVLRQAIRALHSEYVVKRKMALRVLPRLFKDNAEHVAMLKQEGYRLLEDRKASKTLLLDVSPTMEQLRANFIGKWRGHLNSAEKQGLTVHVGEGDAYFEEFAGVYRSMLDRKKFDTSTDLEGHRRIQAELPERYQMSVIIARKDGKACAAGIFSFHGSTAVYLFGATNEIGMKSSGSYLVQWEALKLMKTKGMTQYDFHGINQEANPGTYMFKKGAAGKTGREVDFVGQYQAFAPSVTNYSLLAAEAVRHSLREWL